MKTKAELIQEWRMSDPDLESRTTLEVLIDIRDILEAIVDTLANRYFR